MLFESVTSIAAAVAAGYIGIKLFCPWFLDDIRYLITVIPVIARYERFVKNRTFLIDHFESKVKQVPDKLFLLYEDQKYTYKQANENANNMARVLQSLGLQMGDTIAIFQYNCPEYIWTFLGCLKVGIRASLINTNLRGKALVHCISLSDTRTVLVGSDPDLMAAMEAIADDIPDATFYVNGSTSNTDLPKFVSLQSNKSSASIDDIDPSVRKDVLATDAAIYIFTSGTTGLPKAAKMAHRRLLAGYALSAFSGLCDDDVIYVTLPLYHSSGLIVGVCSTIYRGATCVIGKKFSRTRFWQDVRQHKATAFIYIGEMCRYLLTNDKTPDDRNHSIRMAIGNGLRQDIFAEFKERYGVQEIREFYASTEGVTGFMNLNNTVGACGRSTPFLERVISCGLYQYDFENECLVRDSKGHCVQVKLGQPGLLLMEVNKKQTFDGYKGAKEQSEKKIIKNVRKDGDVFFNSGDLMSKDKNYNLYFNDRVGDTFRWKSENVSTTEVSNLMTDVSFIIDAAVYGVEIPGCDGRAGMATLLIAPNVKELTEKELSEIANHCNQVLPVYAIPLFLRIKWEELDMTSTIKQSKVKLKQEGFDYWSVSDPMFYYERSSKTYRSLTKEVYEDITNQTIRF